MTSPTKPADKALKRLPEIRILGLDPGFANFGWSIVTGPSISKLRVVELGCFETVKSDKKMNVLDADDDFRRVKLLSRFVHHLHDEWAFAMVCAETLSPPRSSTVAKKMGMVWGMLADFCQVSAMPMVQATPKQIKTELCPGKGKPTDKMLHAAVRKRYPNAGQLMKESLPTKETKHEHPYDSLGAVEVCKSSDLMLTLFRRR